MDFPSPRSDGQIVTVGRLFFGHRHFLGRGCDVLQVGSVGPVISLYPLSSDDRRPKWDCVFQMSQRLKMGSESWSKWNSRANGSAHFLEPSWEHSVKVKRFLSFFGAWCLVFFILQKLQGAFVLCAWCFCDFCFHCVFVFVVSVCEDSFTSTDLFYPRRDCWT